MIMLSLLLYVIVISFFIVLCVCFLARRPRLCARWSACSIISVIYYHYCHYHVFVCVYIYIYIHTWLILVVLLVLLLALLWSLSLSLLLSLVVVVVVVVVVGRPAVGLVWTVRRRAQVLSDRSTCSYIFVDWLWLTESSIPGCPVFALMGGPNPHQSLWTGLMSNPFSHDARTRTRDLSLGS